MVPSVIKRSRVKNEWKWESRVSSLIISLSSGGCTVNPPAASHSCHHAFPPMLNCNAFSVRTEGSSFLSDIQTQPASKATNTSVSSPETKGKSPYFHVSCQQEPRCPAIGSVAPEKNSPENFSQLLLASCVFMKKKTTFQRNEHCLQYA